ncbi:GNAT family N-acetyltransferase [Candidatus Gottesmanbacteria bacterium]|nr:GNAT family N-acetyltransferase [Candidatus Gottesmanbacteria bacterium]
MSEELLQLLPPIIEYDQKYQEGIISLIYTTLEEFGSHFDPVLPIDEDLTRIPEVYNGRSRFWVALDGDVVIGTVAIREVDQDIAELKRMFVDRSYRGKRIGLALLNHAMQFARSAAYKDVQLDTSQSMHRAQHYYEQYGFQKTGEDDQKIYYRLSLNP